MVTGGRQVNRRTAAFDPQALVWSRRADMGFPRWYGTQLTLPNDEVTAVFAQGAGPVVERYSAPVDRWTALPGMAMTTAANEQAATNAGSANNGGTNSQWWSFLHVAPDGRVFHSGPWPSMHWYDAAGSGDIEAAGTRLGGDQTRAFGTATMYDVGKVLVAGGQDRKAPQASSREAIKIDINGAAPVAQQASDMAHKRTNHNAVLLPTGDLIVVGGNENAKLFNDQTSILEPEIWDPQTDQWAPMARLAVVLSQLGKTEDANETLAKAFAINPRLSVDWVREHVHSPESRAGRHLIDGLRALGLRARSE